LFVAIVAVFNLFMKKWRKNNIPDPNVLATENVSHKRRGVTRGARGRDSPGAE